MPNCCNTTKLNCFSDYKMYNQNQQLTKNPKPNFYQQFGSDIRHYSVGGVHYQYTLEYPGIFSILNSCTWVKSAEWFQHQINSWTMRSPKVSSPLSSGNPFPETGDKNDPRAATCTSCSISLMDPEPRDEHAPTAHPCPHSCITANRCGEASSWASHHGRGNSRTELAMAPQPFGDTKGLLLVLVVTSNHPYLLLDCLYINLTPELPPLPSSPWSCPPCSFPPVLSFPSLLFIFSLYPYRKISFPPPPIM